MELAVWIANNWWTSILVLAVVCGIYVYRAEKNFDPEHVVLEFLNRRN